ncbi:hypothetical protein ACFRCI_17230 [Streptomyces sp. NPDC056638]|uniref:hypothetical protein n=1 Tax=Streptomyces sp. NPDC056638 TaxID=3345887 RepID=UPI0036B042AC
MYEHEQDQGDGPRMKAADQPNRAQNKRGWRLEALEELEELRDLYTLPKGLEVPL